MAIKISLKGAKRLGVPTRYDKDGKPYAYEPTVKKRNEKKCKIKKCIPLRKKGNLRYFRAKDCV